MFRYNVVWSGMGRVCGRIFGGKKAVVDFLVHAVKVIFSVGVPGALQPVQEGVNAGERKGWKFSYGLIHERDLNASWKKAVSLESLRCLDGLKSFA